MARHIANVLASVGPRERPPLESEPLRIRLMEEATLEMPYLRPFAEGIMAVLMLDLPETVTSVSEEDLLAYGLTAEEAWGRAEAFHRRDWEFDLTEMGSDSGRLWVWEGESPYAASQALSLSVSEADGPHGMLVAVPNRHVLLAAPVVSEVSLGELPVLAKMARRHYAQGPGSISPRVFWAFEGSWSAVELPPGLAAQLGG